MSVRLAGRPGRAATVLGCVAAVVAGCLPAAAQTTAGGRAGRHVEVAIGGGVLTGDPPESRDANLRASSPSASPSRLFSTTTRLARAGMVEGRVGVPLTGRIGVEGRVTFSRPELRTAISADAEGAPGLTATERLDQYLIEAGVVVRLDALRFGRTVPFASGGAGYLRQLHEGQTLVEEGRALYGGGGVTHELYSGARGFIKGLGVRAEARVYLVDGAAVFGGVTSRSAISTGVFVAF